MHTRITIIALTLATIGMGCAQQTRTGSQMKPINSAQKLTATEWDQFANWMKNSMIQNGVLPRYRQADGGPAVIAIADWDNNTRQRVFNQDKVVMENAIRKTLVNSGQAVINRDTGGTGAKPESLTRSISDLRNSTEYDPSTTTVPGRATAPSLGLYMQINRIEFSEGQVTQYDYVIKCELIDLQQKYTVWEDQFMLSKQFMRAIMAAPRNTISTMGQPGADRISPQQLNGVLRGLSLSCSEVRMFPTRGGPLEAQVDIVNTKSGPNRFVYRFEWFDERGNRIRNQMTTWKPATVTSRGSMTISSVGPTEAATDFKLEVQRGS